MRSAFDYYFKVWRISFGTAAMKNTQYWSGTNMWVLWFNVGNLGVWWRRH